MWTSSTQHQKWCSHIQNITVKTCKSCTRLFTLSKQTFSSHVSEAAYYYLRFYRCKYRNSNKKKNSGCHNVNWREFWALLPIIQYNYFLLHKLSFKLKEKATLKKLAIFTEKHLCLLRRDSFIKNRLQHKCFLVNIAKCFEHLFWRKLWTAAPGSQPRVSPEGPTLGSHPMVPP